MHTAGEMQYLIKTLIELRCLGAENTENDVCSVMQESVRRINSLLFADQRGNQGRVIKEAELAVADLAVFHLANCTQDLQPDNGPCPE